MWKWWDTSAGAWGLLAIGVGVGIVVSYVSSPQVGVPVGVAITVAGIILVVRAYRAKTKSREDSQLEKPGITGKLEDVSPVESEFILAKSIELDAVHGHNDLLGLFADRASGVPLNELSTRPCSQCGIPRNQRGKHGE